MRLCLTAFAENRRIVRRPSTEAHRAIDQALRLDPQLAETHLTRGRVLYYFDWDWQSADAEMKQALLLDPSLGDAYRWAAMTAATLGRESESQELLSERAHDLLMPQIFDDSYVAEVALARGDPQSVFAQLPRVASPIAVLSLKARAFRALGRQADADAALAQLENTAAADAPAEIARIHALRGDTDAAFTWLQRAYELHDYALSDLKATDGFNNLKTDPRYAAFLRKMKLPD